MLPRAWLRKFVSPVSRSPSRFAEFPDFRLNDPIQLFNQGRKFPGVGFPRDTSAENDHPLAIFRGHRGWAFPFRGRGIVDLVALEQQYREECSEKT